ncbi:hypothetical protein [Streptomyces sp. 5-10]|uniref:hypothetical protein n=1 Tax=Streptomyces sp. 5-10 TaxID=878925 RepID=UPI00168B9B0A|nr:hypothetical protein [Streptomyces sp. 5-10]MBD3004514.1 hypothetical protein [Streptomyces sp. 5-10]
MEFKYNYQSGGGGYRYYGSGAPSGGYDVGLDAFVVNHLNRTRQRLILDMSNMRRKGESIVRAKSRVDTGRMKSMVTGTGDFGTDILKISFGWETLRPYYAPFQEFGTRRGIEPMMAVLTAYNTVLADLRSRLGGT